MPRSTSEAHTPSSPATACELRLLGAPTLGIGERVLALSPKDAGLLALAAHPRGQLGQGLVVKVAQQFLGAGGVVVGQALERRGQIGVCLRR